MKYLSLKSILGVILLICLLILFFSFNQHQKNDYGELNHPKKSLIKYGEYIYKRENCKQCHTLKVNESKSLISLDGLKDKYDNTWHFLNLMDSFMVTANDTMPTYKSLNKSILNFKNFRKITRLKKKSWNSILTELDSLQKEINENTKRYFNNNEFYVEKKSEILPLIMYLQSISASKEMKLRDSIINAEIKKDIKYWENLVLNENSIVYYDLSNKKSIKDGLEIYNTNCIACHSIGGKGAIGPNLTDNYSIYGSDLNDIAKVVVFGGNPGKGMVGWNAILTPKEVNSLLAYIQSLKGTNPKGAKGPQGIRDHE